MNDHHVPAPAVDLDAFLCFAVYSTGLAFNRVYRRPLEKLGLTYPQYLVMAALWGEDGVPVGHLGQRVSLDTNTLTPLVKRLEGMGLVTRRRSPADERRVVVSLTAKGREMEREAGAVTACIAEAAGLPEADLMRLNAEIRALRRNLERAAAQPPESAPA